MCHISHSTCYTEITNVGWGEQSFANYIEEVFGLSEQLKMYKEHCYMIRGVYVYITIAALFMLMQIIG